MLFNQELDEDFVSEYFIEICSGDFDMNNYADSINKNNKLNKLEEIILSNSNRNSIVIGEDEA